VRGKGQRETLERLVRSFAEARILVIGDIMVDRFIWGKVSRISPEAPVPVVLVDKETFLFGGAANVVHNIHTLGGSVSLCGVVGDDDLGQRILKGLKEVGVQTDGIFVEQGRQTTVKTRVIAHQQQVVRIDRETTDHLKRSTLRDVLNFIHDHMKDFDSIVLSDYGKGLLTRGLIRSLIKKARQTKTCVLVDPKVKNFFSYRGASVITPNTTEASAASGMAITDLPSLKRTGRVLLRRLRCDILLVTRGEEGMAVFEPHKEPFLVPTVAKEVYDVTGAGDTVIGTMALALASGASTRAAANLANYAAGIVVGKVGTATVDREELIQVIRESH
jgi:D-beta-D-heptose 7-phosphate kinase/D-beta-D-heptose 1-phosphate adenosyltransferase